MVQARLLNHRARALRAEPGFSLIELLTVLVVLAIITAIAAPSFLGASGDLSLIDAGNRVTADLNLARQEAMTHNQTVQVRFYADSRNNHLYDTVAHVLPLPTTGYQWLDRPVLLPQGTAFYTAGGPTYSPLITATGTASSPFSVSADSDPATPQRLQNDSYVYFDFRADGSTDIGSQGSVSAWCVTIYPTNKGTTAAPVNYVTILVDPATGAVRSYQPE